MTPLVMIGHQTDGAIHCNLCGIIATGIRFPCKHEFEDRHLREEHPCPAPS